MSRKPTSVNNKSLLLLKEFVQRKAHLSCSGFADIQQLQSEIKNNVNEYISVQTLNRFFGLIKNDFKPSITTLNILARYVNYKSYKEFENLNSSRIVPESDFSYSAKIIISLLSDVEPGNMKEKGLLNVLKNSLKLLESEPALCKDIYPFMASTDFGRRYFFEQFVNIDALNSHYGNGLKYFLLHAKDREQKLFGYCLLAFRYFLTNQNILFDHYFAKINEYKLSEIKTFQNFLIGRYYAIHVYKSILMRLPVTIADEASTVFEKIQNPKDNYEFFPGAEYLFAEALILAQEYAAAWKILQKGSISLKKVAAIVDEGYLTQYQLLQLYAGYCSENIPKRKAIELFQNLQSKPLYFLTQDYYSILFQMLGKHLLSGGFAKLADEKINLLIEKTGFVQFKKKEQNNMTGEICLMEIKGKKIV